MNFSAAIYLLLFGVAHATQWLPLKFPAEPSPAEVFQKSGLANADEETLIDYVQSHLDSAGYRISDVTEREQKSIESEALRRVEVAINRRMTDGEGENEAETRRRVEDAETYLTTARAQLTASRLNDSRRIVDAVIRHLGKKGTEISLDRLLQLAAFDERMWVSWKFLASAQEILPRVDPSKIDARYMMGIPPDTFASILRDLEPEVAARWAWKLWTSKNEILNSNSNFRGHVRLRTRLSLASLFAESHPDQAREVFSEGLKSQDAAIRTAAEMIIRSGIGGSLPYGTGAEQLLDGFTRNKWKSDTPLWEALPLPLELPVLRKLSGGRMDLLWVDRNARAAKSNDDVWPMIRLPLPNRYNYSRVGEFYPMEYGITDNEGTLLTRIRGIYSAPTIASHGGLWAVIGDNRVAEFRADGSILWECLGDIRYRTVVPSSNGRVLMLGYSSLECRDRRGDLLWNMSLKKFNDLREIIPVDDERFLVSCSKSVGWLTRDGKYDPVLEGFNSAGWIRYHPIEPWIILEGSTTTAVTFDSKSGKELGRTSLNMGWGHEESRFPFPASYFPE